MYASRSTLTASSSSSAERLGAERPALVPRQDLDPLLRLVQILGAAPGEAHAFLEDLERLLQRQIPRLELVHELLEALEGVLKPDVGHHAP